MGAGANEKRMCTLTTTHNHIKILRIRIFFRVALHVRACVRACAGGGAEGG